MGNRRVKNMTMQGLRSFPDRLTINLSGGLTCIADPEGYGAEEISSALSFLAGQLTPEGEGPADLIFKGNDSKEPSERMEVSVLVEGDASEGEDRVSRIYSSTGEDQYYLNRKKCTAEEIRNILSGTGIYGYSVMNRNTAFDFLTSRPGTIRDVLEGASETAYYKRLENEENRKMTEALRELQILREQQSICKEKRKYLQNEALKAQEFSHLTDLLKESEINITLRRIDRIESNRELLEIRLNEIRLRIEQEEKKRSEIDLALMEKQILRKNLENREAEERNVYLFRRNEKDDEKLKTVELKSSVAAADQRMDLLHKELDSLRSRREHERQSRGNLEKEGLQISDHLIKAEQDVHLIQEHLKEKRQDLSEQNVSYEQLVEEWNRYQSEAEFLRSLKDKTEEQDLRLQKQNLEIDRISTEKNRQYLQKESLQAEIRELEKKYMDSIVQRYSYQCDAAVNQFSVEKLDAIQKDTGERIEETMSDIERIRELRSVYQRKIEQKERDIRTMEADLSARIRSLNALQKEREDLRTSTQSTLNKKDQEESVYRAFCMEQRALEAERDDCIQQVTDLKNQFYDTFQIAYAEARAQKSYILSINEGLKEAARLRNLLKGYEEVNTAAPGDLERVTAQYFEMETKRRELEEKIEKCKENAGIYRAKAPVLFRQLLEATGKEFNRCYHELSPETDAEVRLEVVKTNEQTGPSVEVTIHRPGYKAAGILKADAREKSAILTAFTAALHQVSTPSLSFLDSLDDVLFPEHYLFLIEKLYNKPGESVLAVTGTGQVVKKASDTYAYLHAEEGIKEMKLIGLKDFEHYVLDEKEE